MRFVLMFDKWLIIYSSVRELVRYQNDTYNILHIKYFLSGEIGVMPLDLWVKDFSKLKLFSIFEISIQYGPYYMGYISW